MNKTKKEIEKEKAMEELDRAIKDIGFSEEFKDTLLSDDIDKELKKRGLIE